jgi:hypothetical protein
VRDPEVGDLHLAVRGQQQVGRLDVAVHQRGGVRGLQARRDLGDHVHGLGCTERPGRQDRGQGRPVHQLHHQEGGVLRGWLTVVVHPCDGRVRQRAGVPGLGPEPLLHLGVTSELGPEQLDRHRPRQDGVFRAPNLANPASRNLAFQAVPASQQRVRWHDSI